MDDVINLGAIEAEPQEEDQDSPELSHDAQRVYDTLPATGAVSGGQLKGRLSLDDDEFKQAKRELRNAGLVILGRGRGGSVARRSGVSDEVSTTGQAVLWAEVQRRQEIWDCKCELRPGMGYRELIELEEGCTGSLQRAKAGGFTPKAGSMGGWVCPVLNYYRENVR